MRVFLIALATLLCAEARAQDLMSPRAFRDAVIARVHALAPDEQVELRGDLTFALKSWGASIDLDIAYYELYRNDPTSADDTIATRADVALAPLTMPKDRTSIVVVLRNKNIADRLHNDGFDIVSRQFVGDLIEVLAFHSDEIITLALERWIRELGLTVDEAWALAPTNLRARMGALTSEGFMPGFRYIATADGDGLAQSLLTQADFCASPDATGKIFHIFGPRSYIEVDRNNSAAVERYIGVHAIAVGGGDCL